MTKHFLVSVIQPVEVTYEVWARDEAAAIELIEGTEDLAAHADVYQADSCAHPAQVIEIAEVERKLQC